MWSMFALTQDSIMGAGVVLLCLMIWSRERWFLEQTQKGQWLTTRYGSDRAPWVLRGMLLGGIVFGGLLASGIIRPIQWG
jgi:hypothetical protein